MTLQTRDPQTGRIISTTEKVDASKVAIVIVDPWNYHWCMTACERLSAMVPRWNRAVEGARKLGMPILWVPSDVVGMYSGYPQRERALAVPLLPVPKLRDMPPARFTAPRRRLHVRTGHRLRGQLRPGRHESRPHAGRRRSHRQQHRGSLFVVEAARHHPRDLHGTAHEHVPVRQAGRAEVHGPGRT